VSWPVKNFSIFPPTCRNAFSVLRPTSCAPELTLDYFFAVFFGGDLCGVSQAENDAANNAARIGRKMRSVFMPAA
jgi:hypothetical protein